MEKCSKCSELPLGRSSLCREHTQEYDREWYRANKDRLHANKRESKNKYRDDRREFLMILKSDPCIDCKRQFKPWQMDFDHLRDKKFNIGNAIFRLSKEEILEEIKKCELVCANCHRDRTYVRSHDQVV